MHSCFNGSEEKYFASHVTMFLNGEGFYVEIFEDEITKVVKRQPADVMTSGVPRYMLYRCNHFITITVLLDILISSPHDTCII
jgi:hypothetical protein